MNNDFPQMFGKIGCYSLQRLKKSVNVPLLSLWNLCRRFSLIGITWQATDNHAEINQNLINHSIVQISKQVPLSCEVLPLRWMSFFLRSRFSSRPIDKKFFKFVIEGWLFVVWNLSSRMCLIDRSFQGSFYYNKIHFSRHNILDYLTIESIVQLSNP